MFVSFWFTCLRVVLIVVLNSCRLCSRVFFFGCVCSLCFVVVRVLLIICCFCWLLFLLFVFFDVFLLIACLCVVEQACVRLIVFSILFVELMSCLIVCLLIVFEYCVFAVLSVLLFMCCCCCLLFCGLIVCFFLFYLFAICSPFGWIRVEFARLYVLLCVLFLLPCVFCCLFDICVGCCCCCLLFMLLLLLACLLVV